MNNETQTVGTLQQRINENAAKKLRAHLVAAAEKQNEVKNMIGNNAKGFPFIDTNIKAHSHYNRGPEVDLKDEFTKSLWDAMLPNFIKNETDALFDKLAEMESFINGRNNEYDD